MLFYTQTYYGTIDEGVLGGRIYISENKISKGQPAKHVQFLTQGCKGSSFSYYSSLAESLLSFSCNQQTTAVNFIGKVFHLDNESFIDFILRRRLNSDPISMHALYKKNKTGEYSYNTAAKEKVRACLLEQTSNGSSIDLIKLIEVCTHDFFPFQIQSKILKQKRTHSITAKPVDLIMSLEMKVNVGKMWKNAQKAVSEHRIVAQNRSKLFLPYLYTSGVKFGSKEELHQRICTEYSSLITSYHACSSPGARSNMEDCHFSCKIPSGYLFGVLDGHGGAEVAKYVAEKIQEKFSECLESKQGDIYSTFTYLTDWLQKKIEEQDKWSTQGATAVFCFIDIYSHLIYTATIGDSEAKIYRKDTSGLINIIPLSCVRDWTSKTDAKRAAEALQQPNIAIDWVQAEQPKKIYFPLYIATMGLNVSRAIGDKFLSTWKGQPGVIHKPKITVNFIKSGDQLILASDGFWDIMPDHVTINCINKLYGKADLIAKNLLTQALRKKECFDNVTILSVFME